jgi:hypothetical protein
MSRKDKLLSRFLSYPKDFTYDEAVKLLSSFSFYEVKTGKTSGSAIRFESDEHPAVRIRFHKPHPGNILKPYVLDILKTGLDECNLLTDENRKEDERDE